jgi:hypothetical protein
MLPTSIVNWFPAISYIRFVLISGLPGNRRITEFIFQQRHISHGQFSHAG